MKTNPAERTDLVLCRVFFCDKTVIISVIIPAENL